MSKADHLAAYAEGWTTGNSDKILSALAENYVLDDPNHGRVAKGEMAAYLDGMKAMVSELRDGKEEAQFLALSELLTGEEAGELSTEEIREHLRAALGHQIDLALDSVARRVRG